MEENKVLHYQVNQRYSVKFEKAASANKVDGFKVEANGDDMAETMNQAVTLYNAALKMVSIPAPEVK